MRTGYSSPNFLGFHMSNDHQFTPSASGKHTVILLPAHPASFAHNIVSGMQNFYFSKSQDAIVLHTSLKNSVLDS